jgi:hypothetical protein
MPAKSQRAPVDLVLREDEPDRWEQEYRAFLEEQSPNLDPPRRVTRRKPPLSHD